MNALVGIRANVTGLLSPRPAQLVEAARQVTSLLRARVLGQATKAADVAKAESETVASAVNQELDRDAFLRLLVLQMQYQDPLDPVDNSEMIAQLAQFSALEQMTALNESFALLSGNVDQLNFISASALLGRTVTGVDMNGSLLTGVVDQVHLDGSTVLLSVGGQLMSMAGVLGIEPAAAPSE